MNYKALANGGSCERIAPPNPGVVTLEMISTESIMLGKYMCAARGQVDFGNETQRYIHTIPNIYIYMESP